MKEVKSQSSKVKSQWSMVNGQWSMVNGQRTKLKVKDMNSDFHASDIFSGSSF